MELDKNKFLKFLYLNIREGWYYVELFFVFEGFIRLLNLGSFCDVIFGNFKEFSVFRVKVDIILEN